MFQLNLFEYSRLEPTIFAYPGVVLGNYLRTPTLKTDIYKSLKAQHLENKMSHFKFKGHLFNLECTHIIFANNEYTLSSFGGQCVVTNESPADFCALIDYCNKCQTIKYR